MLPTLPLRCVLSYFQARLCVYQGSLHLRRCQSCLLNVLISPFLSLSPLPWNFQIKPIFTSKNIKNGCTIVTQEERKNGFRCHSSNGYCPASDDSIQEHERSRGLRKAFVHVATECCLPICTEHFDTGFRWAKSRECREDMTCWEWLRDSHIGI